MAINCPICGNPAASNHHIRPRSVGGGNSRSNQVGLCSSCHDIVEAIYDLTGVEYSPALVHAIRVEYGLGVDSVKKRTHRAGVLPEYTTPKRTKRLKFDDYPQLLPFTKEGVCPWCNEGFLRTRRDQALCMSCGRVQSGNIVKAQKAEKTRQDKIISDRMARKAQVPRPYRTAINSIRELNPSWSSSACLQVYP